MTFTINDLVVHPGTAPEGRVIRVVGIQPWPVVVNGGLIEDATAQCHGTMIIFDRLVATSPAPVDELRLATVEEIRQARQLNLLPPAIDGGADPGNGPGDREPRGPGPGLGSGGVALAPLHEATCGHDCRVRPRATAAGASPNQTRLFDNPVGRLVRHV